MENEEIFQKILVSVDGSVPSLVAQELTAFMAKKFNSKVTVIHVVSHELMSASIQRIFAPERHEHVPMGTAMTQIPIGMHVPESPTTSLPQEVISEITEWYRQKGDAVIDEAIALFKEEDVTTDRKLVENADPAQTILKEVREGKHDLVVIGQSEEGEKDLHLGSVAKKVLFYSSAPVLIARKKSQISKILVPVDGSEHAEEALQYAVVLAKKTNAAMMLLNVQESGIFKLRPELTKEIGNRILSRAAAEAKGIKLNQKLESGDPAKIIIQTADKGDYDLIVMGSRGLGVIEQFLLGSVSDHVTHYANSSVLIVK
jgi:nucleotide-binding universal stress UspA family protein